ncbi:MAG: DUF559 domain-containing protein [Actinomycetes bacterium]
MFQHATGVPTPAAVRWAAVLGVGGRRAVGLDSAAAGWGWCADPPTITLVVDVDRKLTVSAPVKLRRLTLADGDLATLHGLPVTSRARTLADCLRFLAEPRAQEVLDRSQQRRGPALGEVMSRLPRGGAGVAQAKRLLRAADGSVFEAERLCVNLLRRGRIDGWQVNRSLVLDGRTVVVDVAFVRHKLALEIDGWAHHQDRDRFQADRTRQNLLIAHGWRVLRFTYADLTLRPDAVLRQVTDALRVI